MTDHQPALADLAQQLKALEIREHEFVVVCYEPIGGKFSHSEPMPVAQAQAYMDSLPLQCDVWFSANPVRDPSDPLRVGKRGVTDDVTRLANLRGDFDDSKCGGTRQGAWAVLNGVSRALGMPPVVVTMSGWFLHGCCLVSYVEITG